MNGLRLVGVTNSSTETKAKMFLFGRICNLAVLSICILNAKTIELCDDTRITYPRERERERGRGRTSPYAKGGKTRLNIPELLSWIKD